MQFLGGFAGDEHRFRLASVLRAADQRTGAPDRHEQAVGVLQGGLDPGFVLALLTDPLKRAAGIDIGSAGKDDRHGSARTWIIVMLLSTEPCHGSEWAAIARKCPISRGVVIG